MSHETLIAVFADVLSWEQAPGLDTLRYNEFPGWDSVGHMTLVAAIEEKFDIMMDNDEILGMSDFNEAIKILAKHNVAE